jgi:hypothetical protein
MADVAVHQGESTADPLIRKHADPPGRAGAVFRHVSAKRPDEHDVVEALRHKRCAHSWFNAGL